ncbi:histone H1, gonadal-like [Diorhabda carinulata]|uniref:histone H1, gonadal-like n=1 Tax=Diorhabda carinulata TaxID=1163345 RepID=UPI0025A0098E|nr:histone H1, gonadal-like [Diorhabda carinulata]
MTSLLSKFVDTIVSFKDRKGSSLEEILNNINSQRKNKLKINSLHVKKALEIGVKTGLLKKSNGKFKLGIETKYYDLLKNFRYVAKRWSTFKEKRRNGRSQQGKQHRRGKNIKTSKVSRLSTKARNLKLPIKQLRSRGRRDKNTSTCCRRKGIKRKYDNYTSAVVSDRSRRPRRKGRKRRQRRPRRPSKYGRKY